MVLNESIQNTTAPDWRTELNTLAKKLNVTPTQTAQDQWENFATQCANYNGVFSIHEDKNLTNNPFSLVCKFPDLTNTREDIMALYNTNNGKEYFTTMTINDKIKFEKTNTYTNSTFGKKNIAADKRRTAMQATFYFISPSFTTDDGTTFWPIQEQSAKRVILQDKNLELKLHGH